MKNEHNHLQPNTQFQNAIATVNDQEGGLGCLVAENKKLQRK